MKKILNKKLAQKGGMMIEALAMLGLIAVVTPTMYKKSAERTLEVEDINTATNMRSVMTAADSYVNSNYAALINSMSEGETSKIVGIDSLRQYLPYGFDESKLYDYKEPIVSVVRRGDNLTSFVLFPAKENGENGIGQERTVRIATLIGANGGYVNGTKTAKGIGGVWSLDSTNYENVFKDNSEASKAEVYSIITASSEAINSTNAVLDSDKFLYRTDADGKWRTTMRADLFLGGFSPEAADGYNSDKNFSIRNVKRLIIGANSVNGSDPSVQATIDESEKDSPYGLYLKSSNGIGSAFIEGSLEAAESQFMVDTEHLNYKTLTGDEIELNVNSDYFTLYSLYGSGTDLSGYRDGKVAHQIDARGSIFNYGEFIHLAQSWDSESGDFILGTAAHPAIYAEGDGDKGYRRVSLIGNDDKIFQATSYPNAEHSENDKIVMMGQATKGTQKGDSAEWNETVKYNTSPAFPVRIGSNAKVEGILSAAQVDAQKVRLATLEAGSENIDDEYKWLRVDAKGIHGSHLKDSDGNDFENSALFEVHDNILALGVGDNSLQKGLDFSSTKGNRNIIFMSKGDGSHDSSGRYTGINMVSTNKIDIAVERQNDTAKPEINLKTNVIQEQLKDNEIVISSLQNTNSTTAVKLHNTNFQVNLGDTVDSGRPVFSVKSNYSNNGNLDYYTRGNTPIADVAVHGNTMFTTKVRNNENGKVDYKYMYIGDTLEDGQGAVINIGQSDAKMVKKGTEDGSVVTIGKIDNKAAVNIARGVSNASEGIDNIMFVDVGADSLGRQMGQENDKGTTKWYINDSGVKKYYNPGVVYVRKGGVEILPDRAPESRPTTDAWESAGTIAANRFVANNLKSDGTDEDVPQFYTDDYEDYNGTTDAGRYDTYMVNPAYTSVMHDIKLTTRGGARLSDILPDFINKGIYITSNTVPDKLDQLTFKFESSKLVGISKESEGVSLDDDSSSGPIVLGSKASWASPYLGFVPAPQCPPGYNRLITLAPQSFMMSQAGQMQQGTHARGGNAYYTKNQVPENSAFDKFKESGPTEAGNLVQQSFKNIAIEADANVEIDESTESTLKAGEAIVKGKAISAAQTGGLGLITGKYNDDEKFESDLGRHPYVLVSHGDTTPPLTIQQSTWLKTNVIPVGSTDAAAAIGNKNPSGYVRGWAAIMGFVYDKATYKPLIDKLKGVGNSLIEYEGSDESVYWNIFPVRRNTLEAYATTYCYFDRNGIMWPEFGKDSEGNYKNSEYIDHYNALQDYKTNTENKHRSGKNSNEEYLKRLNDPALKYNEVW